MKKILLTVALVGLAAQAAADQAPQSNWYALAGASYTYGDGYEPEGLGGRGGEDGFGWTLGSGWMVNQQLNFELAITSKNLNAEIGKDIDQYGLVGSGLFFFSRDGAFNPYMVFGIGGVDNSRIKNQGFELYASGGFGFLRRLGDGPGAASMRLEARAIAELGDKSLNDAVINFALQIPIGSP